MTSPLIKFHTTSDSSDTSSPIRFDRLKLSDSEPTAKKRKYDDVKRTTTRKVTRSHRYKPYDKPKIRKDRERYVTFLSRKIFIF